MAPLLHDARALAVIFPQNNKRPASYARRCQIGQSVRGDIDSDRPLDGYRAANRIMNRGREHRRRCGFIGVRFKSNPQFVQQILGIRQDVHQMGNRCALIAADIAHTIFQQRLGDRQNTFTRERIAIAQA